MARREEFLQGAKWRRALAVKARDLSRGMTDEAAQRGLLEHADNLDRQAEELEAQAMALCRGWS
jgi:hypothetical protein